MTHRSPALRAPRHDVHRVAVTGLLTALLVALVALATPILTSADRVEPPVSSLSSVSGSPSLPALTSADGLVPDGVTVFDTTRPAVVNLDADLLTALRRAATDAAPEGVTFFVNSGWRSPAYQDQLLNEAVATYGSPAAAARWVATAATSPHVSGHAVDIGPPDASTWLSTHGATYGLCPVYANEPWHYELRLGANGHRCPGLYADPTQDPRMQP